MFMFGYTKSMKLYFKDHTFDCIFWPAVGIILYITMSFYINYKLPDYKIVNKYGFIILVLLISTLIFDIPVWKISLFHSYLNFSPQKDNKQYDKQYIYYNSYDIYWKPVIPYLSLDLAFLSLLVSILISNINLLAKDISSGLFCFMQVFIIICSCMSQRSYFLDLKEQLYYNYIYNKTMSDKFMNIKKKIGNY